MNQQVSSPIGNSSFVQSDIFKIKKFLSLILGYWYWLIISIAIAGVGAYFFVELTYPTYRVSTTILIEESENNSIPGVDNNLLKGFGLRPGSKNLDNQILILSSWTLIRKTLSDLPFDSDCYKKRLNKRMSYYPLDPIRLVAGSNGAPNNIEFCFQHFQENIYRISFTTESEISIDTFMSFGHELALSNGSFTIFRLPEFVDTYKAEEKINFEFSNLETLSERYKKRLVVETATKDGTILTISLEGTNRAQDILFLNKLMEVYMASNLEKKNHEAKRIIEFIDNQLVNVSDSLIITETRLQEFRSRNRIMDISAQAQQIIDQAVVLENEKARLTLEANYYNYLDEYLAKESNSEVLISPATMDIEDPLLGRLMQELAGLHAEFFSSGVGERNPLQSQLELRIRNTKKSLRETLRGIKLANSMAMDENKQMIMHLNNQASGLPIKERQLLGFERKFNLNNVLYTFLLQKRAESQIQKASNMPDNELIDSARAGIDPISPNIALVYLFGALLGLGLPVSILLLREAIHNKISSEEDIKMITDLPIMGYIPHSRLKYNTVVLTEPQSRIAESYRSLRTRMEFFSRGKKSPVILITSSMPGDGKTFSSINLASAYSLIGKKTIIVEYDLRRPTLSQSFGINETEGLSTYLIGKSELNNIIFETGFPNLHVMPSGPIPPNPGELAASKKAIDVFDVLREKYDYIIVDTAPIGAVADNYSIASIADATLVSVRHGQTNKKYLESTLLEASANNIPGLGILVNDVKAKRNSYRYANYKYTYK